MIGGHCEIMMITLQWTLKIAKLQKRQNDIFILRCCCSARSGEMFYHPIAHL